MLIKSFISHGSVPHFVLLCTLLPLVKDNLGDITSSTKYRAIASGNLLLKLLDIVILLLEGDKTFKDHYNAEVKSIGEKKADEYRKKNTANWDNNA